MLGGGVLHRGVGVRPAPGQNRRAVDDHVTGAHHAAAQRLPHQHNEEHLTRGSASGVGAFAHLGGTGHPRPPVRAQRQPTGGGQRRPGHQPIMHVLVGEPPQDAQQRDQQQTLLAVDTRRAPRSFGQRGRTPPLGQPHGHATQLQQVQTAHHDQRRQVQGHRLFGHRALVCWGWDRCCAVTQGGDHGLTSRARGLAAPLLVSLPYSPELRNALSPGHSHLTRRVGSRHR